MLLITGITGHTGRYFLQELIEHQYRGDIRCVVRPDSDTALLDNSGLTVEKVVGDLNDKDFIETCMNGVTVVFHIFSIRYSLNILKAAIRNHVSRAILVHTTGIYSRFKAASDEYKEIEHKLYSLMQEQPIQVTILRPTMIYGDVCDHNMSKFIKMVDKLRLFPVIDNGQCLIQPVNARDLGKAYYRVLLLPGSQAKQEYILSGEKPIMMLEAFKIISQSLNKKTVFLNVPLVIGVFLARTLHVCTIGKIDYIEKVQRMGEDRCFPHDDAAKDFGYNPMPFEQGIKAEVEEYLEPQIR